MSRFQITVKFCTNSICRYRHSFLGHIMLELIGTVLIHKKNDKKNSTKKSLIVSKTVQSVPTQEFLTGFFLLYISHYLFREDLISHQVSKGICTAFSNKAITYTYTSCYKKDQKICQVFKLTRKKLICFLEPFILKNIFRLRGARPLS